MCNYVFIFNTHTDKRSQLPQAMLTVLNVISKQYSMVTGNDDFSISEIPENMVILVSIYLFYTFVHSHKFLL